MNTFKLCLLLLFLFIYPIFVKYYQFTLYVWIIFLKSWWSSFNNYSVIQHALQVESDIPIMNRLFSFLNCIKIYWVKFRSPTLRFGRSGLHLLFTNLYHLEIFIKWILLLFLILFFKKIKFRLFFFILSNVYGISTFLFLFCHYWL
jgi:hypothetical protein